MNLADALALPVHPVADLFPMYPTERSDGVKTDVTIEDLAQSISTNGIREPITVWRGQLVDGRNRLTAAKGLGIVDVPVRALDDALSPEEVDNYILDLNVDRRSLTAGQRAMIAVGYSGLDVNGGDRRSDQSANLLTDTQLSERFRVSERTIGEARRLFRSAGKSDISDTDTYDHREDDEVTPDQQRARNAIRQVRSGKMSLNAAKETVTGSPGQKSTPDETVHPVNRLLNKADRAYDSYIDVIEGLQAGKASDDQFGVVRRQLSKLLEMLT